MVQVHHFYGLEVSFIFLIDDFHGFHESKGIKCRNKIKKQVIEVL